jgi:predicted homoserine dehydrogenase-like protein
MITFQQKNAMPEVQMALVGAGSVGKGIYHQSHLTAGIKCSVVCDILIERAIDLVKKRADYSVVKTTSELVDALRRGETAVCSDSKLAAVAPGIDVFFDASTAIDTAPATLELAISSGKHIVMMNAEADALFGPWLWQLAQRNGVAYTSSDGDQPAVIARLVEEMRLYGFEIAMVGNIKGYMDRTTDPIKIVPEAEKRQLDPKMCSSYTDGTKLSVEMSIVANSLGGRVLKPGMLGPRMKEAIEMFNHFQFDDIWRPGSPPLVDYILGARPRGGIFVVGYMSDLYQRRMLDWFPPEIGPGPFYMLTRPYHLIHLEAMRTVLEVSTKATSIMAPRHGMKTEVIAYAKQSLKNGDLLDGAGGFASYGVIENKHEGSSTGLPILLSDGVRLRTGVTKDSRITWEDIDMSTMSSVALKAYNLASSPFH